MFLERKMSTLFAAIAFVLVLSSCDAFDCYIEQQPDPASGNKLRWVLPYTRVQRCHCSKILFGGFNAKPMEGWKEYLYTDEPLQFVNNDDPESLTKFLECDEKNEHAAKGATTRQPSSQTEVITETVTLQQTSTKPNQDDLSGSGWTGPTDDYENNMATSQPGDDLSGSGWTNPIDDSENELTTSQPGDEVSESGRTDPTDESDYDFSYPTDWHDDEADANSTAEFSECSTSVALGMQDGRISNRRIVASSSVQTQDIRDVFNETETYDLSPYNARLGYGGCWIPSITDTNKWIQVYVGLGKILTGITSQGFESYYVKTCYIEVQKNDNRWKKHKNGGSRVFVANTDATSNAILMFDTPILTSVLRIQPIECTKYSLVDVCALRMEILGCKTTPKSGPNGDCVRRLGMESHKINQTQITISEENSPENYKNYVRLNNQNGCWIRPLTDSPWMTVSFRDKVNISGIIIQGCRRPDGYGARVKRFKIQLGNPTNPDWESREYDDITHTITPVTIIFDNPVETNQIKVIPTKCNHDNEGCAVRMEILGPCET
ncbi:neuropilin-1-like [Amphiura filiformis]|uniref:neuropilin-1-like n=1 Tax=Amphiura filiformis TaxID=82378 RepID=UPI003B212AFD